MKLLTNRIRIGGILVLIVLCSSCMKQAATEKTKETELADIVPAKKARPATMPVQYQRAPYVLDQQPGDEVDVDEESVLKVGARITSKNGPQPLWDIVKRLVALKKMNVSWASDVDKDVLVDVDISPEDDFYQALDNMLRQVDYFHEVQGKTIVVKYRATRQFQIAMPFTKQKFSTMVGGNLLGSSGSDDKGGGGDKQIDGVLSLDSEDNEFDLWDNIKFNLDTILEVWNIRKEKKKAEDDKEKAANAVAQGGATPVVVNLSSGAAAPAADAKKDDADKKENTAPKSYYTIDKPVGLITVTAPRPVLDKVNAYLTNLKRKLYKQIAIEAKIIEVQIDNESNVGINWNNVFKNFRLFSGALSFGANGQVYPLIKNNPLAVRDRIYTDRSANDLQPPDPETGIHYYHNALTGAAFYDAINPGQFISKIALNAASFEAFLNALKEEGKTKILSNPKISVMNGQPAMITVGQNRTYIDKVDVDIDTDSNTKTYTTSTSRLLAGVGMALTATILDNKEIIMNLVPITSELVGNDIPYEFIGSEGAKVGVPIINVREMSTTVRVGDGEMLVIGGLISDAQGKEENFMPGVGKIPGVRYLFGYEKKKRRKRELIILLRPKII